MIEYIKHFFLCGYSYTEILQLLQICLGVKISYRHLKRILAKHRLYRKKYFSNIVDVAVFVVGELQGSAVNHGYRWFHSRAIENGFVVTQETIRHLLLLMDCNGVKFRQKQRLSRRLYCTMGPNSIWHCDGYDKLKPYGICIHGCIDGFSRKIIWLNAYKTNNDPYIIADYYMSAIKEHDGCPERIRCDFGTENGVVKEMQIQLRSRGRDCFSAEKSFLCGKSTSNQRIESWWGQLRRHGIQFWMDIFWKLQHDGYFTGTFLDKSLVQFCFMGLLQEELYKISNVWNNHKIRKGRNNTALPYGRPFLMYNMPDIYGGVECKKVIEQDIYQDLLRLCVPNGNPCCDEVFELCCIIVDDNNLTPPSDIQNALNLYMSLRNEIMSLM